MTDASDLLDISEAAQFLNVCQTSLRRWTSAGALPCLRVGRHRERRFRRADLLAFLEQPVATQRSAAGREGSATARHSIGEAVPVTRGNHLCAIYGSQAGRISFLAPFLLEGLERGSVCLLAAPGRSRQEILKDLEDLRPGLASDIKKGRLVLAEHRKSADAQWNYLETRLKKAEKRGATSFRVAGDMIGRRARVSPRELIEFESGLDDKIIAKFPVAILALMMRGSLQASSCSTRSKRTATHSVSTRSAARVM